MDSQPSEKPIPQPQARTLLSAFTTFLTLTVHTILYHRRIYPPETFLLTKHHNLPVYQSRHPGVCSWINDAVAQVRILLAHGRLKHVCINIHHANSLQVLERWVLDVSAFPTWVDEEAERSRLEAAASKGKGKELARPMTWAERDKRAGRPQRGTEEERDELERAGGINWADVDESIRGALRRIAYAAETKGPAENCTFTIAVELGDDVVEVPSTDWIPSQPDQQPSVITSSGSDNTPKTTTPLRTVQAGPLFFECWVEEAAVEEAAASQQAVDTSLLDASFSQDSEYP